MSEQFYPAEQQVDQVAVEDAVVVIKVVRHIHADDDLFEEILGKHQRRQLGGFFFIGIHAESGLNIDLLVSIIYHKVDLPLNLTIACTVANHPDINGVSAPQKLVVNHVFHDVTGIVLAIIQPCISKPNIRIVILVRILEIGFPLDIIPLSHRDEEGVDNILHIV